MTATGAICVPKRNDIMMPFIRLLIASYIFCELFRIGQYKTSSLVRPLDPGGK